MDKTMESSRRGDALEREKTGNLRRYPLRINREAFEGQLAALGRASEPQVELVVSASVMRLLELGWDRARIMTWVMADVDETVTIRRSYETRAERDGARKNEKEKR